MFCINLESSDPFFNLAIEEFLLINSKEEYLIIGINNPSVIIGKHQVAHKEINTRFINENDIQVIRRISGGGTVFHDRGNLNFTFIRQSEAGRQVDFRKYTKPVIDFLFSLGTEAKFEGRNDIKIGGFKISGNAEHIYRNRVLHHGTLLFSSSLEMLGNSLRKDKSCYTTRAVDSTPSSVMNLGEKLKIFRDIYEFRSEMTNYFLHNLTDIDPYELSISEIEGARLLASEKYKNWEWNYAYGPDYAFSNCFQFKGEPHNFSLLVKDGLIIKCEIEGSQEMLPISKRLIGLRHMVTDIMEVFDEENIIFSNNEIYNFF
jgi:lipoate-protein ligase A